MIYTWGLDRFAAMRRLMLFRHAKSDRPPGVPDKMRPLNARGTVAAGLMGAYMNHHDLVPDLILCSPARRTRDTLAAVAEQWQREVNVSFEEGLYDAPRDAILSVIAGKGSAARNLMVIGHNPGLHEVAQFMIATGDVAMRERLREKFPTAAMAVIDFAVEAWDVIHRRSGRLERFITPRSLAATTN